MVIDIGDWTLTEVRGGCDLGTGLRLLDVNIASGGFTFDPLLLFEVPFYVGNLDSVFEKHQKWQTLLPRVTPFYAVKCNNNLAVLRTLSALGTGFDCASKREIEMVMSIGVTPDKIIYAHTTKPQSHIRYACAQGVDMMTFDNEEELLKKTRGHPNAKLLLRIAVDDSKSQVKLSTKFGATLGTVGSLLKRAHELDLDVLGVCKRPTMSLNRLIGFHLDLLDIGGGFSGHELEMMSKAINEALDEFFPADSGVRVIAEPGRYFVDSAFTLALNVFARKKVWNMLMSADGNGLDTMIMYYVTDGLYGAFGDIKLYPDMKPFVLRPHRVMKPRYQSVIWGPTCDSADRIMDVWMPELNIGDWILVDNFGAYTIPMSTDFNGFEKPTIYLVVTPQIWKIPIALDSHDITPMQTIDKVYRSSVSTSTVSMPSSHFPLHS
uniref:ornithine decarboxylase n=1 Tax=Neogobius melanostomus TaxID=47308 RepID=A0A8C6SYB6_9GOBI